MPRCQPSPETDPAPPPNNQDGGEGGGADDYLTPPVPTELPYDLPIVPIGTTSATFLGTAPVEGSGGSSGGGSGSGSGGSGGSGTDNCQTTSDDSEEATCEQDSG